LGIYVSLCRVKLKRGVRTQIACDNHDKQNILCFLEDVCMHKVCKIFYVSVVLQRTPDIYPDKHSCGFQK